MSAATEHRQGFNCVRHGPYQRRRKTVEVGNVSVDYIEVSEADIALALQVGAAILRRTADELAPPTRTLLAAIRELVTTKMKTMKVPQEYACQRSFRFDPFGIV